jgi:hypothetical protein
MFFYLSVFRLTHDAPRYTKRAESRPEQHYRQAAIRNTVTRAAERRQV